MKATAIFLFVLFNLSIGFCQYDTSLYLDTRNRLVDAQNAVKHIEIKKLSNGNYSLVETFMALDKSWQSVKNQIITIENDSTMRIHDMSGTEVRLITIRKTTIVNDSTYYFREYTETGKIVAEGYTKNMLPLHLIGTYKRYYENGQIASIQDYEDNQMKSNQNWLENGEKYIDNIVGMVDAMPKFKGGESGLRSFISQNTKYPKKARKQGIQGNVYVDFVVMEDGAVDGVQVLKSVHPLLDEEAMRVVKLTSSKWTAGILDGQKVRVKYRLPFAFKLN